MKLFSFHLKVNILIIEKNINIIYINNNNEQSIW